MLEILVDSTGARVLFDLEKERGKKNDMPMVDWPSQKGGAVNGNLWILLSLLANEGLIIYKKMCLSKEKKNEF